MTDYTKTTNFATKDALPSGNANKIQSLIILQLLWQLNQTQQALRLLG